MIRAVRTSMTKTAARQTVRDASATFAERERRIQDMAVQWVILNSRVEAARHERDQVTLQLYQEGISRSEIAQRLGIDVKEVPTKRRLEQLHHDTQNSSDHDQNNRSNESVDHSSERPEDPDQISRQDNETT